MKDESLSVRAPLALIIDDDEAMRLLARVVLEQCGLRVIEAESGTSGLAAFSGDTPDIVLLDVQMPGKDGFAVCSLSLIHISEPTRPY